MGTSKAWLPWRGSTLLQRTCSVLLEAVTGPVLVVRSPGQDLPSLPDRTEVHDDLREGLGPVQGLAVGLGALGDRVDVAFVCSTDLPFLNAAYVRAMTRALMQHPACDAVVPLVRDRVHPLAAAYRPRLAAHAQDAAATGRLRLRSFLEEHSVLKMGIDDLLQDPALAAADPTLRSVTNVNDQQDYARALDASRG